MKKDIVKDVINDKETLSVSTPLEAKKEAQKTAVKKKTVVVPGKKYLITFANYDEEIFAVRSLLEAQKKAHKAAAARKTVVISVVELFD